MIHIEINDTLWSWGTRNVVLRLVIFTTGVIRRKLGYKLVVQGVRHLNIGFGEQLCRYLDRQLIEHYA